MSIEVSWFAALCDDDYEFLGVPNPELRSSYDHCRDITLTADRNGFDNILMPSGYTLGIDTVAFAAGVAPLVEQMQILVAVRMGEVWLPQLARQLATIDQMMNGRLTINIISSDIPGEKLESEPRYQRTREWMTVCVRLLNGETDRLSRRIRRPRSRTSPGPDGFWTVAALLFRWVLTRRQRRGGRAG